MSDASGILIGVDIGSTACKVQAVGADGVHLALASALTPWEDTPKGRQLDPEVLFEQLMRAIHKVAGAHTVLGIGVTGFAESGVIVDRAGKPVAPILPWYDQHGSDTVSRIEAVMGTRGFAGLTGLPLNLKPSIMKFEWFMHEVAPRTFWSRWMNVPEWFAYRLTGVMATEPSLASRTGIFDVVEKREAEDLLACVGAPSGLFSELRHAGESWGVVTGAYARLAGASVTVCGMDHLSAGVGVGATGQANLLDSCGTGEALIRRLPAMNITRATLVKAVEQEIAVGRDIFSGQVQLTASLRSGIGMWRFLKLMGKGEADMEELDRAALRLSTTPSSPVVDNVWLENASLSNIGYEPDPAAVWRATVEAVQRRASVLVGRMQDFAGAHDRIVATGGGLRSLLVRTLKKDILGPFEQPEIIETASRGAALLAGMAAGVSPPIAVETTPVPMAQGF